MLIETTEDFKRVKNLLLKEGIRMTTPHTGATKIEFLAYKNEMLFFKFDSGYNEEVILNLRTGVKHWLSTEAEILMSRGLLDIIDTSLVPREKANLLTAAERLPLEELENVLQEAEEILTERKSKLKNCS